MEVESCIPPGFRFHPTEEELVGYYLTRKVNSQSIDLEIITDIDLYGIEPWDLQASCKLGCEEQSEWYFFSHKDKKYPTGTRTKRATAAGFWKATGRDKAVLSKDKIIGMRKTLVFYWGRAPNGKKTDWIMHEYRLQISEHAPPQEEGWVVCRAFKKQIPSNQRPSSFRPWDTAPTNYLQYHSQFGSSQAFEVADFCPTQIMTPHNHVQNNIYEQSSTVAAQEEDGNGRFQQLESGLIHHDWKTLDHLLSTDHQLCETASYVSSSLTTVLAHLPCETFLDS